jgi:drug/metabolite transporter (DMT)-like permease
VLSSDSPIVGRSVSPPGLAFILTSAAAFALQGLFARLAYEAGASAITVGLGRFGFTALVFWAYALLRRQRGSFPLIPPRRTTLALLGLGGIGYFLGSLTYLEAVTTIPVSLAGLLLYTYPAIATVLAAVIGREWLTRRLLAGLAIALAGVALTLGVPALAATHRPDGSGIVLVLLSAVLYSMYIVGSDRMLRGVHTILAMAYISAGATISFALLTALSGDFTPAVGWKGWGSISGMAVVSTVIAAGTFLAALRRLGPSRAATLSTIEPLLTVVFAAIVLSERLDPAQLFGGLVLLAGVVIVIRERSSEVAPGP